MLDLRVVAGRDRTMRGGGGEWRCAGFGEGVMAAGEMAGG
jgi:hypothetical protein